MLQQRVRYFIPHSSSGATHPVVEQRQSSLVVRPQRAVLSSEPGRLFRSPCQQALRVVNRLKLTLLIMVVFQFFRRGLYKVTRHDVTM
jgi:hypothetical protein